MHQERQRQRERPATAAELAGDGRDALPCAIFDGDCTGHKKLTKGLGTEEETPAKEIGAAWRSFGGSYGAAALRTREREGEWCAVKRRWCRPFYNSERSRGRGVEAVAQGRWAAAINARRRGSVRRWFWEGKRR
jgi:hypothetical protein